MTWQPTGEPAAAPRLRPLGVGEIIDVSFRLYRKHFVTFVALAAVGVLPGQALSLLISLSVLPERRVFTNFQGEEVVVFRNQTGAWATIAAALVTFGIGFIVQAISAAATTKAVADGYVGDQTPTFGDSLGAVTARLGAVIVASLLYTLGLIGGFILCILPGVFLATAWVATTPALMIERLSPTGSLRRSLELVRGRWWPAFGLQILLGIITGILTAIITLPITAIVLSDGVQTAGDAIVQTFVQTIAVLLFAPLSAIAAVVLYFDLRVRKEGFDLLLQQQNLGTGSATAGPTGAAPYGTQPSSAQPPTQAPPQTPPPPDPPQWGAPPPPPPS